MKRIWELLNEIGVDTTHATGADIRTQGSGEVFITVTRYTDNRYWDETETEYTVKPDGTLHKRLRQEDQD